MKNFLSGLLLIAAITLTSCFAHYDESTETKIPQSVIVLISDGTGISQITALRYSRDDFAFFRFPVVGLFTTHALDQLITDSAASGTALSTGMKTNNRMIAMSPDGTKVQTVLEAAETIGKSTGLVATSQITHATPASFASHVESRYMEMEIARQIANQEIEVLLGGGQRFFLTNDEAGNLVEQMTLDGYSYIDTEDELQALNTAETEKVLGLFAESGMPAAKDGRLPLSLMSQKAVEILDDDPDGFFIMIEASQVDWEGHDNDGEGIVAEMQDMNDALTWLLNYQEAHPDVLVLWIADHETGGTAVDQTEEGEMTLDFTSRDHTAQMIPAFAIGPGAQKFSGVYDNADIGKRLIEFMK